MLNANDVFDLGLLQAIIARAAHSQSKLVLVGRKVAEPWRFGVMHFDSAGRLIGVVEKPPRGQEPSDVGVVGVYYFAPDIFQCIRDTPAGPTDDQFERAYQLLIDRGQAAHVAYDGIFESYKFPWNLLSLSDLLLAQQIKGQRISPSARISQLTVIEDNVVIEDKVRVFEHAVIRGPAYIGAGSVVVNGAMVWGGCSFGPGCVLGFGSEIKHSIFGRNVWTHRNYVGDSVISDNCSFGGWQCAIGVEPFFRPSGSAGRDDGGVGAWIHHAKYTLVASRGDDDHTVGDGVVDGIFLHVGESITANA